MPHPRKKNPKAEARLKKKAAAAEAKDTKTSAAGGREAVLDAIAVTGNLASRPIEKNIKIDQFSISLHGKELVKDAAMELTCGRRYGLLGANGSGKSTILKVLAAREVPIPDHTDIWHLSTEAEPSERTALEAVVDVVKDEYERLEAALLKEIEDDPESPMVESISDRLDEMDPQTFEKRAAELLHGLGFPNASMHKKTKDMSGGWRMRVALAQALFVRPQLLLLDEPTNHLDLEACVWLEDYLAKYDKILMVISHSQDFLNGVCTHICHLTVRGTFEYYTGNYDMFVQTKKENDINQLKKHEKEQEDIKHLKAFIASCGTYANLVKQAQSKQKIIDKMEAAGLTPKPDVEHKYQFKFADSDKLAPPVLSFSEVSFSYSGNASDYLYTNLDFGVDMDSRVALVGPNGAGKSTLLKLMEGTLEPCEGTISRNMHLRIGRYNQHSADQLDLESTPLDFMRHFFRNGVTTREGTKVLDEEQWRQKLGQFGITGQMQKMPMKTMSDGLQTRVVFCLMSMGNPHVLMLDEPTNHLDMECIDALAEAINRFNGGLVLVSHDFRLISQVAKEVWVCDNKAISKWDGDIISYKQHLKAIAAKNAAKVKVGK